MPSTTYEMPVGRVPIVTGTRIGTISVTAVVCRPSESVTVTDRRYPMYSSGSAKCAVVGVTKLPDSTPDLDASGWA